MGVQIQRMNSLSGAAPQSGMESTLRAATRRIRLLMTLRYGSRALCGSAVACLLCVGLSKLRLFALPNPWLLAGLIFLTLCVGVALALLRPLTALEVAKITERRADLKERLSSAVEFRAQGIAASEPFYGEQMADADRSAAGVDLKALYPLRWPRELPGGLLAALALFLVYFLPTLPAFMSPQQRQETEEVKRQGVAILKLAKDTQKLAEQQKLDETKKAAEEARKLGEAMQKAKMNKKQALIAMQKLTQKMEETQKRMAANIPPKSMEQAHQDFKRSLDQMQREQEQERKQAQKQAAQNPAQPSPAMKQAQMALQQMAQAMADMNAQQMQQAMQQIGQQIQSGQMSKEEMKQVQQALQKLAQSLQNTQMNTSAQQLQQLAQMMQSMNNMDPGTLQQMAAMCQNIGKGMGMSNLRAMFDMKALQQLAMALKDGRLSMCMGMPAFRARHPGHNFFGLGGPSKPIPDPGNTKPRLLAIGPSQPAKGIGKTGSAKEFLKYLARTSSAPKHLPNGKIPGSRSQNGQELQTSFTGDPESSRSSTPYYSNVYETSKRQAESTLDKENIPATYKEQVRHYFENIRP
ncbi:MAG TPA: hypothetical protein VFA07_18000 [Chthonomonadaceae bacterium]|nr:hypothetical protein [Chthonomonadaceae bacterium]